MPAAFRDAHVGHHEDPAAGHGGHQRLVHLAVAHQVREAVHPRLNEVGSVVVVEDVRDDLQVEPVGLVDDRPVDLGRELLDRPPAVVDPDLDERDALLGQRAYELATLGGARHPAGRRPERRGPGAGVRRRQSAAGREEPRPAERPGLLLAPNLPPQTARVGAEGNDGADPVVGVAIDVIEDVLARVVGRVVAQAALEADVPVEIDERGDDRLPGGVDNGRPDRDVDGAARSGCADDAARDHQRRLLDRRRSVAGDQACALVDDGLFLNRRGELHPARRFDRQERAAAEDHGQCEGCCPGTTITPRCGRRDPRLRGIGGRPPHVSHRIAFLVWSVGVVSGTAGLRPPTIIRAGGVRQGNSTVDVDADRRNKSLGSPTDGTGPRCCRRPKWMPVRVTRNGRTRCPPRGRGRCHVAGGARCGPRRPFARRESR